MGIRVGVDATNIRTGGGVTHLAEILRHANPADAGIARVTVWGPSATLSRLPDRPWLVRMHHPWHDRHLAWRLAWQRLKLDRALGGTTDVLLVPGGSYAGRFRPFVAMAQNLLPFDLEVRRTYPIGPMRLRARLLARTQGRALRRADGAIFLTEYGRDLVERAVGPCAGSTVIIPLGATPGLLPCLPSEASGAEFRWLYMSAVEGYKNHTAVLRAAAALRDRGHRLRIDFVGGGSAAVEGAAKRVQASLGLGEDVVRWVGPVPPAEVPALFARYDGAVYPSSCESFGIPLVDGIRAGLPTACASRSTLPEVAGDAVLYFDPGSEVELAATMERLMADSGLRRALASRGPAATARFDWTLAARDTMRFLADIARTRG
jgi:glycosyltransferase involved in cell wall biosynthesis